MKYRLLQLGFVKSDLSFWMHTQPEQGTRNGQSSRCVKGAIPPEVMGEEGRERRRQRAAQISAHVHEAARDSGVRFGEVYGGGKIGRHAKKERSGTERKEHHRPQGMRGRGAGADPPRS